MKIALTWNLERRKLFAASWKKNTTESWDIEIQHWSSRLGNVDSSEYQWVLDAALPSIFIRQYLLQPNGAACRTSSLTKAYFAKKKMNCQKTVHRRVPTWRLSRIPGIIWILVPQAICTRYGNMWRNSGSSCLLRFASVRTVVKSRGGHIKY